MKRLTVDLPEEIHKRFKLYCVDQNRDMSEVIRKLVEDLLQKADKKKVKS